MQPVNRSGIAVAQLAEAKKIPIQFLLGLKLADFHYCAVPAERVPYFGPDGQEIATRFRLALTGDDRFRWRKGSKAQLYGQSRLGEARNAGYCVLVEGESDCWTLWHHGVPAVGLPGAATWREDRDAALLAKIPTIYLVVEPDRGGQTVVEHLGRSSLRDRLRLVSLNGAKDPSELHLQDTEGFKERWQAVIEAAVPYEIRAREETDAERRDAWEVCQDLARDPNIIERFKQDIEALGVVGEGRTAKIVFLMLVSRLLDRPVSGAIKGPSSAGKSFTTEQTLLFFPPRTYHTLTAMSERALAFSEEPLAHRFLVILEAAGMEGDFASYLIRSLLSEGRIRYEVVEKTSEGLRSRLIEREGPTGLLVTTTAVRLHPENETRLFSLPVTDTREQTEKIFKALAQDRESTVDFAQWHALQAWIEGSDNRVHIPYSQRLAALVPVVAVRLRRDFKQILALIKALAIVHQGTRERDKQGRIIATLDDYAVVRELAADLVAEGVEASVKPAIRETVEAVEALGPDPKTGVTVKAIAAHLRIDKSAASRRVGDAANLGYLQNLEDRKGRPSRLVIGDPLPEALEILPSPDRPADGCTVDLLIEGIQALPSPT